MTRKKDYVGQTSGRLTVIGETVENGKRKLVCRCECGNTKNILPSNFSRGHTLSCGCLKNDIISSGAHTTHGLRSKNIRLYNIWKGMRKRCRNPKSNRWERYGGRGITVCDEWDDYSVFYQWAMKSGYSDELSIDRIDNDKGYYPGNCRWSSPKEQANNRKTNHLIEMNGEIHTIAEWSNITGIDQATILQRIKRGCNAETVLSKVIY